jgi:hypothetical protein
VQLQPFVRRVESSRTGRELGNRATFRLRQLVVRWTLRPVGFRRVEPDKSKGLTRNANCVAINNLDLPRSERGSVRDRGDKGDGESERAERLTVYWRFASAIVKDAYHFRYRCARFRRSFISVISVCSSAISSSHPVAQRKPVSIS